MGFQRIIDLVVNYGYIILFWALAIELVGAPTPGETLLMYCGFLVFQGKLSWGITIIVATSGVVLGITTSYSLGLLLNKSFFEKYGFYIHLGSDNLEKVSKWFNKYGNHFLIFAYFIPGIRHITGYFSGITKMSFVKFTANAYLGALIWTTTFVTLGRVLGYNWEKIHVHFKEYFILSGIAMGMILGIFYWYKAKKQF